jgi:hypothetical protein
VQNSRTVNGIPNRERLNAAKREMQISQSKSGVPCNHGKQPLYYELYKKIFRSLENLNHYSEKDYRNAERKFLKYSLEQRKIEMEGEPFGE